MSEVFRKDDVNDYDEYFLGGMKSFYKDSFFKSMFSSFINLDIDRLYLKNFNMTFGLVTGIYGKISAYL